MRLFTLLPALALLSSSFVACNDDRDDTAGDTGDSADTTESDAGDPDRFRMCEAGGECVLTYPGCCESCSAPTLDELVAVNGEQLMAYREDECPGAASCPACESMPPEFPARAACLEGLCEAVDVSAADWASCESDTDCRVTTGCCCEGIFAMSITGTEAYTASVCDPEDLASCGECNIADGSTAACVEGLCRLAE